MTDFSWTEPESDYAAQYPYNHEQVTESGHIIGYDDTPNAERIRTQHRTGSFTEIQHDGTEVHKIVGEGYEIVASNKKVLISGFCTITIEGDANLEIKGDSYSRVKGNRQEVVEGDYDLLVKGRGRMAFGTELDLTVIDTDGSVFITGAADALVVNGDSVVHGNLSGDSLNSNGSVTAATGIHAGTPGSLDPFAGITTLGGINVGFPGPTEPGVLNALIMATSPLIIGSVMTYGTVLMDPEGGNPLIRMIYDSHVHPAPNGTTGGPIPLMLP